MVIDKHAGIISPKIDLERSELRYIFYAHDQQNLVRDFRNYGFIEKVYKKSPITKTIYFGSKIGLRPGLSIKARIYTSLFEENILHYNPQTLFNVLEIKSSVSRDGFLFPGVVNSEIGASITLTDGLKSPFSKDILFRIQRASEDGLLRDSNLKTKSRVTNLDLSNEQIRSKLTLKEIVTLICKTSPLDKRLSEDLRTILNNKIRPFFYNNLQPYFMTQYARHHLIPEEQSKQDFIRVTIDPGVEYYQIGFDEPHDYIENPSLTGEYLKREKFCRLEIKVDPNKIRDQKDIEEQIGKIIRKYGCIAYISKKWSGVTLVSERHIEKQAFWKEPLGVQISGFFPIDSSWFSYGQIPEELFKIIESSRSFSTYEKEPQILVKNENFVLGYMGVPIPSLIINVQGPNISYNLPSDNSAVKMINNQPEFYIMEEYEQPVRSKLISSKEELDNFLHPSIEIEGYSFFRSYGFLVVHNNSNRVYKLTIERKTDIKEKEPKSEIYCKLRYLGNKLGLAKIDKNAIYMELQNFYEEFYPIMDNIISEISSEYLRSVPEEIRK